MRETASASREAEGELSRLPRACVEIGGEIGAEHFSLAEIGKDRRHEYSAAIQQYVSQQYSTTRLCLRHTYRVYARFSTFSHATCTFQVSAFHHGHAVGDGHGTAADENDLTLAARAEPASHEPGLEPLQILP